MRRRACTFVLALLLPTAPAAAQTWTGAASAAWHNTGNWTPAVVPSDQFDTAVFTGAAPFSDPTLFANATVGALSFSDITSSADNYFLTSAAGTVLTLDTSWFTTNIYVAPTVSISTTQTINLAATAGGNLRFTGSVGFDDLFVNNEAGSSTAPTLVFGPTTAIASTTGTGGIRFGGSGHTRISGGIVSNIGSLAKTGTGELSLTGTTMTTGDTAVYGGRLTLDYGTSATSKLPDGGLFLRGAELRVVNSNTSFTETFLAGTTLVGGHSVVRVMSSTAGGIDLRAISRNTSTATADFARVAGTSILTTNTNVNGILGGWAIADGGASWATVSGGAIVPLTTFNSNAYASGFNTSATGGAAPAGFTTNSLRLASGGTLTLSGTNTIQSGGILVPSGASASTLTGGILTTSASAPLFAHVHGFGLTINSSVAATSLVKTGSGNLELGGFNSGLTGTISVHDGGLRFTTTSAVSFASSITFTDTTGGFLSLGGELGDGVSGTVDTPISLAGYYDAPVRLSLYNISPNSQTTYSGVISSSVATTDNRITIINTDSATGRIRLAGTNTFFGDVELATGTLAVSANANLGSTANRLVLDTGSSVNGGLEFLADFTLARPVEVARTGRVVVNGGGVNTISGALSGSGALYKAGTGTLVLSSFSSTHTGGLLVEEGTLRVGSDSHLGDPANNLTVNEGATFATTGTMTMGTGRFVSVGPTTGTGDATFDVATFTTLTVQGVVANRGTGTGGLTKAGEGTLVLSGTNAFTGLVRIDAGTLRVGADVNLGNVSNDVSVGAGATFATTATMTMGAGRTVSLGTADVSGQSTIDVAAGTTLTVPGFGTFFGSVTGLVKAGAGTLVVLGSGIYSGGTTVSQGTLQVASNSSLGTFTGPVAVEPLGMLAFAGTTTTGRTYTLMGSTLSVAAGQTLTFANATVGGGFLVGGFASQAGTANTLVGNTTPTSTTMTLNGTDALTNFTNGGQLTAAAAAAPTLTRFTNTASGRLTVDGPLAVSDFTSTGRVTVNAGGTLANSGSVATFGGGSVTTVNPTGMVTLGGSGTQQLGRVAGGLLVNNGRVEGGRLVVDYGGRVTGTGTFSVNPLEVNGGKFSPGSSPGRATVELFIFDPNGGYTFEINNATGTAGPIGTSNLSGWDLSVVHNAALPAASALVVESTPATPFTISLVTLTNPSPPDEAGPMANFDTTQSYMWLAFDVHPQGQIVDWDPAAIRLDRTGVANFAAGEFGIQRVGNQIFVTYAPVPEPAFVTGVFAAGLAGWHAWRRKRVESGPGQAT